MPTDGSAPVLAGKVLRGVATALNAALAVLATFVAIRLWQMSATFLGNAGGLPDPAVVDSMLQELTLALASPPASAQAHWDSLYARLYWWTLSWICGVFAVGAALVAVAGMRWAWTRLEDFLARG